MKGKPVTTYKKVFLFNVSRLKMLKKPIKNDIINLHFCLNLSLTVSLCCIYFYIQLSIICKSGIVLQCFFPPKFHKRFELTYRHGRKHIWVNKNINNF